MEYKYWSGFFVCFCILLNVFGIYWLFMLLVALVCFVLGIIAVIYLLHTDPKSFLELRSSIDSTDGMPDGRPQPIRALGLNLDYDKKSIILLTPDVRIQTESKKHKNAHLQSDTRKKSFIDSGIELLFNKHNKHGVKDGDISSSSPQHVISHPLLSDYHKCSTETTLLPKKDNNNSSSSRSNSSSSSTADEHHKWKLFDSIKIHTDKRKSIDATVDVHIGQECEPNAIIETTPIYKLHNDSAVLDEHGSPTKKFRTMLSGHKQIDQLLHTIINYILRDFIDSWFFSLSDNKEFSEFRTRNCIEESLRNVCARIKNTQWTPLMTTKLVDIVAMHARLYRKANDTVNLQLDETKKKTSSSGLNATSGQNQNASASHHRTTVANNNKKLNQHRRNKSETDLSWYLSGTSAQKNVGNSKFYEPMNEMAKKSIDKNFATDAGEAKLIKAFFNQCELYRDECLDEQALEDYLTHCMETVLYFTLPEEDFACVPLRMFLSTLLANVVCKPIIDMLSEPDFLNLQVAKLLKEPPTSEIFLRLLRQCDDLGELKACRQLITREMDAKCKDPTASAELNSLKYTQKLIDIRISFLQNNKIENERDCKPMYDLPILTLDELLNKELTLSYYLDYLSIFNLQHYVIFYLTAREWKATVVRYSAELQSNKKGVRDDIHKMLRNKASNIHKEYLAPSSINPINIDSGLIETLNIRLNDSTMMPDPLWFESICKYVYEKIKNENIFLVNFYQSSSYRNLLMELEFLSNANVDMADIDSSSYLTQSLQQFESSSDSNSGDLIFDDELDFIPFDGTSGDYLIANQSNVSPKHHQPSLNVPIEHKQQSNLLKTTEKLLGQTVDLSFIPIAGLKCQQSNTLDVISSNSVSKHYRSHSDCTGLVQNQVDDIRIEPIERPSNKSDRLKNDTLKTAKIVIDDSNHVNENVALICPQHRISAKIINTAINCDGQFAVYAIQVTVIEDNQQKSWHVYRRYSRFLDLKKLLVRRYPSIGQIPFPAKKTFHNTQRSVLEHRMTVINEFLKTISMRADDNDELHTMLRDFLEPDTNDKKIHGGAVIRTIETIVNPFKTGIRTIKNMPDSLVGGMVKILLGRGPNKESAFLDVTPIHLEHSSEYPALTSALNLLDEVFDLQARSQWLRRGLINRLLGAPWVSQAANKRITQAAKTAIEVDKIEHLLNVILNTIWPDGKRSNHNMPREETTKQRTKMAAKMALFTLIADDLKRVVGSETTRSGLLNCFSMWQHKTLNMRLVLVLFNEIVTTLYQIDSLDKHVK